MLFTVIVAEKVNKYYFCCRVLDRIQESHVATVADKTVIDRGVKVFELELELGKLNSASVSFRNEPGIGTYFSLKNVFRLCTFLLLDHGTVN